jgi:hypothetical protein
MSGAIVLKTAITKHESHGPRVVPNFAIGALDAWSNALHDDLGCGTEDDFVEWLATKEGGEILRLTYAYAARLTAKRAAL